MVSMVLLALVAVLEAAEQLAHAAFRGSESAEGKAAPDDELHPLASGVFRGVLTAEAGRPAPPQPRIREDGKPHEFASSWSPARH